MKSKVHVIGAGGHARAVIGLLQDLDIEVVNFHDSKILDDENICGVLGTTQPVPDNGCVVLGIGDNQLRKERFQLMSEQIGNVFIHPTAYTSNSCTIGKGSILFPKTIINTLAVIGENCIINSGAIVEHEAVVGSHSHISVGANVCGRAKIGESCFIGAGAIVKDQVCITNNVILGAGAVVIKDIVEPGVYIGIPAKKIKI